jgi:hypothetical protein
LYFLCVLRVLRGGEFLYGFGILTVLTIALPLAT